MSSLRPLAALALAFLLGLAPAAYAQSDLWALEGLDPVSFFEGDTAAEGRSDLLVRFRGQIYHFVNERNLLAFEANPRGYLPQFGGLSVVDLAEGHERAGDADYFAVHGGALYLMRSADQRATFLNAPGPIITAAKAYVAGR